MRIVWKESLFLKCHIPHSDHAKNALSFVTFVTLGWIRNGGGSFELTKRRIKGDETAYRASRNDISRATKRHIVQERRKCFGKIGNRWRWQRLQENLESLREKLATLKGRKKMKEKRQTCLSIVYYHQLLAIHLQEEGRRSTFKKRRSTFKKRQSTLKKREGDPPSRRGKAIVKKREGDRQEEAAPSTRRRWIVLTNRWS